MSTDTQSPGENPANGPGGQGSIEGLDLYLLRCNTDSEIVYVNTPFCRRFNTDKQDLIGKNIEVLKKVLPQELHKAFTPPENSQSDIIQLNDDRGRVLEVRRSLKDGNFDLVMSDVTDKALFEKYIQRYVSMDLTQLDDQDRSTFRFPERRHMSVSFTDLRGFTAMSEKMSPEDVRNTVNAYLEEIIHAIDSNGSTVDKIVGDEVVALYGAPKHYRDHALRAVITACDQLFNLRALRRVYAKMGKEMPECGIGINTGDMVVGNLGSSTRQDYTVMGSAVNLAARLCGVAQGSQILMTEATLKTLLESLPENWAARDDIDPKGAEEGSLSSELRGKRITIGTKKEDAFRFTYLRSMKMKGIEEALPVISVEDLRQGRGEEVLSEDRHEGQSVERIFGRFKLVEKIGQGGMGEVWKARDQFGNTLALKMLLAGESASDVQLKRFQREAEIMSRLQHRGICRIVEVGEYEQTTYIAMEHLDGLTLREFLHTESSTNSMNVELSQLVEEAREQQLRKTMAPEPETTRIVTEKDCLSLMIPACDALIHAHSLGILHRDLKPGNIMISPTGEPVIMDFGLAKLEHSDNEMSMELSMSGQLLGTLGYISPEQARGAKDVDASSDVYSLAAVCYQMMTGKRHFNSTGSVLSDANALQEHRPTNPREHLPSLGEDLATILIKALNPDRAERYRSITEFRDDLDAYRLGRPISARSPTLWYRTRKYVQRNRVPVTAAALVLFVCLSAGIFFLQQKLREVSNWGLAEHITTAELMKMKNHWNMSKSDDWQVQDGRLVSKRDGNNYFLFGREINGDVAIEFNAMALGESSLINGCDLSVCLSFTHRDNWLKGYIVQAGGQNNEVASVLKIPGGIMAAKTFNIKPDIAYHVRAEKEGRNIRLYIDGRKIIDFRDVDHNENGDIGIYTYGIDKAFWNFKLYRKGMPELVSPLTTGERLYRESKKHDTWSRLRKEFEDAALSAFEEVTLHHKGKPVDFEARQRISEIHLLRDEYDNAQGQIDYLIRNQQHKMAIIPELTLSLKKHDYKRALSIFQGLANSKSSHFLEATRIFQAQTRKIGTPVFPAEISHSFHDTLARHSPLLQFDCRNANLNNLDFLKGSRITSLKCSGNPIDSISVLKDLALTHLYISQTRIRDLSDIIKHPFKVIDLGFNAIDDLSGLNVTRLHTLKLNQTKVHNLGFLESSSINNLQMSYTPVDDISNLKSLPLKALDISNTRVIDLSPLKGKKLRFLDISNTRVKVLTPLTGMPIRSLNARGINIERLDDLANPALKSLVIRNTSIHDLTPLKDTQLSSLDISNTRVSDLSPIQNLKLTHIEIDSTDIQDISPLRGMPLKFFNADNAKISDLKVLQGKSLLTCYLNHNPIKNIKALNDMPIRTLTLNFTHIESIAQLRLPQLRKLTLSNTRVKNISALKGLKLNNLNLSFTPIDDISALQGIPLHTLNLVNTRIKNIDALKGMPLKRLNLASTQVDDIGPLRGLPLITLDLRDTPVRNLDGLSEAPWNAIYYHCPNVPIEEIERLIPIWQKRGCTELVNNMKLHLLLRHKAYGSLKQHSRKFRGRSYLLLPAFQPFSEAMKIANAAGGHLLQISDVNENNFITSFDGLNRENGRLYRNILLGARFDSSSRRLSWIDGSPMSFQNIPVALNLHHLEDPGRTDPLIVTKRGQWGMGRAKNSWIVIEWKD